MSTAAARRREYRLFFRGLGRFDRIIGPSDNRRHVRLASDLRNGDIFALAFMVYDGQSAKNRPGTSAFVAALFTGSRFFNGGPLRRLSAEPPTARPSGLCGFVGMGNV